MTDDYKDITDKLFWAEIALKNAREAYAKITPTYIELQGKINKHADEVDTLAARKAVYDQAIEKVKSNLKKKEEGQRKAQEAKEKASEEAEEAAEEKRYGELVAKKLKELGYGYIDIKDYNCEQADCVGWDGISKRCECGNRRVYWRHDISDDEVYVELD